MKKRLAIFVTVIALICGVFAVNASAESAASKVEMYCTVNSDGDCLVRMTVNFRMEAADKNLTFPLPANAQNITMNGGNVSTSGGRNATLAAVGAATNGMVGEFTVWFDYTVPKAVKVNADRKLQLDLPMLCGFEYPVSKMTFSITLPGEVTTKPSFVSTYQQSGFDSNLDLTLKDNMITGATRNPLNDHEYVTMSMVFPPEAFPSISTYQREGNPELIPMGIFAGLAMLYWLLKLRNLPPLPSRSTTPPPGVSAGELLSRLTLSGCDLTTLIFSWAVEGYLLIQMDGKGRVLLHKRMDMGNERSQFEMRTFQSLFGSHRVVDCSGTHYAELTRRMAKTIPNERIACSKHSGNRKIYRGLLCIAMLFCGICVAMNMTGILGLQIVFSVLFGIFGLVSAWQMQAMPFSMHSRRKANFWLGLGCALVWIILGLISGQWMIPLGACVVQMLSGFLLAFGGMRTERNRFECGEILGLRRFLKKIPKEEAARLQSLDPEYFFRMAPNAIAMGVGRPFANAFGKRKLPPCPFFLVRVHGKRTAAEWMNLMLQAVSIMDERSRRMELEKWMAVKFR